MKQLLSTGSRSLSFGIGFVLLIGCQGAQTPAQRAVIDTLDSGVISVHNVVDGVSTPAEAWSAREISRIGSVSGDGADVFGAVGALTVDAFGRIWVYDRQAKDIRVFNKDGAHVRTVGRAGAGPGEFNEVVGLLWSPEGNLWTVDQRAARVSVFDSAGTFLTSRPLDGTSFYYRWPGIIDHNGYFYNVERNFTTGKTLLLRLDSIFRVVDSIAVPEHPDGTGSVCRSQGRGSACTSIPYAGTVQWAMTRDGGLWAAFTDQYRLLRLGPSGDTLRLVSKVFEPVPLQGVERDTLPLPMLFGKPIERSLLPATKPVIANLLLDDQDNIWVVRFDTSNEGSTIDILDQRGIYQNSLTLPVRISGRPVALRNDELVTVVTDSLGVNYVSRFRIRKP
jgi:hypothetical protein